MNTFQQNYKPSLLFNLEMDLSFNLITNISSLAVVQSYRNIKVIMIDLSFNTNIQMQKTQLSFLKNMQISDFTLILASSNLVDINFLQPALEYSGYQYLTLLLDNNQIGDVNVLSSLSNQQQLISLEISLENNGIDLDFSVLQLLKNSKKLSQIYLALPDTKNYTFLQSLNYMTSLQQIVVDDEICYMSLGIIILVTEQGLSWKCDKCYYSCSKCFGTGQFECLACKTGYFYNPQTKSCSQSSPTI